MFVQRLENMKVYVCLLCVSMKVVEEKSFSFDTRYSGSLQSQHSEYRRIRN